MTSARIVEATHQEPTDRPATDQAGHRLVVIAAIASVIPFFVAAIRDGLRGFVPTRDVASTVLRSRDVLGTHPPLIGMWSAGSSWAGHEIHFPGAIELYVLAIPVHLFGNSWGTLLAMATLNALWILLAGWLLYRRLGVNGALVGYLFIALFLWTLGSENLLDPAPMQMVTIPFFVFLIAVWCVSDADLTAILPLVVLANYLLLSHLVLTMLVPVLSVCAIAGFILGFRHLSRTDPGGKPERKRVLKRRVWQGALITLLAWTPSIVQELYVTPGNLSQLFEAAGQDRNPVGLFSVGYRATIGVIAKPPFWFRESILHPPSLSGNATHPFGQLVVTDIIAGVILGIVLIGLIVLSVRRRDRTAFTGLAIGFAGIAASIANVMRAPGGWGFPWKYLRSIWGVAAFVWLAMAVALYRALRAHWQPRVARAVGGVALLLFALTLPSANFGAATDLKSAEAADRVARTLVPKMRDRGKIYVHSGWDFDSQRYFSSLLLAFNTAGIPYCVSLHDALQYGAQYRCHDTADVELLVAVTKKVDTSHMTRIAAIDILPEATRTELNHDRKVVKDWLSTRTEIELTPVAFNKVTSIAPPDGPPPSHVAFSTKQGNLTGLVDSTEFRQFVYRMSHRNDSGRIISPIAGNDVPARALYRWARLEHQNKATGTLIAYEQKLR